MQNTSFKKVEFVSVLLLACTSFVLLHEYHLSRVLFEVELVYLSAVNADVQGTAKWIELKQTGKFLGICEICLSSSCCVLCKVFKSRYHEAAATKF